MTIMDENDGITGAEFAEIERRCVAASPGPWKAFLEGRDHMSGDSMIRVGDGDEPDMYVSRDHAPASVADLDFIAHARQTYRACLKR